MPRQRQQISAYIEGFLQREHTGPEHLEELTTTLRKLCGGDRRLNVALLKESIEMLSRAAESRELRTAGHGDLVARYTEIIARALRLPAEETADLVYAARVHDVGKIFVPERILNKPGPLTDDEFTRSGGTLGWVPRLSACFRTANMMRQAIEHHHQRFDGPVIPMALMRGTDSGMGAHHRPHRRLCQHADGAVHFARRELRTRRSTNWPR